MGVAVHSHFDGPALKKSTLRNVVNLMASALLQWIV